MDKQPFESTKAMKRFLRESIVDITDQLKIVDQSKRFEILTHLLEESKSFNELMKITGLQKSALGNHLNILTEKNLVQKFIRGLYEITDDGYDLLSAVANWYLTCKLREHERMLKFQKLIKKYTKLGDETMNIITEGDLEVKIIKLAPRRVVVFKAEGKAPEFEAFEKLKNFAEPLGLLGKPEKYPVFGFNNPEPTPDSPEYGYEVWITIDSNIKTKNVEVKEFEGGLYAVTTTRLIINDENIVPAWKRLYEWVKQSKDYKSASHQWLEKHLNPTASPENLVVDLYCPIQEV